MRKLAAGNWKMNGTAADLAEVAALIAAHPSPACEVLLCPPATLIDRMATVAQASAVRIGGQDCHSSPSGAHTGDISATMLRDAGASHVILGHSERRADHGETDATVQAKAVEALSNGLVAIICLGETLAEREGNQTVDVVTRQLTGSLPATLPAGTDPAAALVIAYEPVWAIGTGLTPTLDQIAEVHGALRGQVLSRFGAAGGGLRILYGGSVKPSNAAGIFALPNVDGALVGGASLKAADFGAIISALDAA